MTVNVLIGVGGTGAKVVEAALHMFLAGMGPSKVVVGLVDQDNSNGNVERTRTLLADIIRARADWSPSRDNRLDWASDEPGGGTLLGRVELEPLFPDNPHWRPTADEHGTLAQILDRAGLSPDHRTLFDLLFAPGDEEQDMPLDQGYRGRAHIGSAAMLASLELGENSFKRRISDLMTVVDQDVRIFLVGSVFGGTGAAGFPTISRVMNKAREGMKAGARERIYLGGALMLPYFSFNDPDDEDANVVRTAELMPQARVALEYYHRLFADEPVFDRFYVAGWDRFFQLGYHEAGNRQQRNPPLPPELLGALAAIEFFGDPKLARSDGQVPVWVSARAEAGSLGWSDLPCTNDDIRKTVYDRMGRLLRLALYWRLTVEPALDSRNLLGRLKTPWMQELASDVNFKVDTPDARSRLNALLEKVLVWAGAMRLFAGNTGEPLMFGLWNTDDLHARADRRNPTDPVALQGALGSGAIDDAYNRLLVASDPQDPPRSAADLFNEVNEKRLRAPTANNKGLGKLLAAVHRAARPF